MKTKKVFITQPTIVPEALQILEEGSTVVWGLPPESRRRLLDPDDVANQKAEIRESLEAILPEINGLFGYFNYDAPLIEAAKNLEVIITPSSGAENVDIATATRHGIAVVNAAGAAYLPVAEHVIGLALALVKRIAVPDRDAHAEKRQLGHAQLFIDKGLPSILHGKTLGIIGFGYIGRELARIASAGFTMDVLAYDPYFDPIEANRQGVTVVETVDEIMAASDFVSINGPLTAETSGMIGLAQLRLMKPSAFLINTARGGLVVTDDLVTALQEGLLAGAGLDVTDPEPLPAGHPLFSFDNVVLTPHLGGIAGETLPKQSIQSARDGIGVFVGRRPFKLANPEVWPPRRDHK